MTLSRRRRETTLEGDGETTGWIGGEGRYSRWRKRLRYWQLRGLPQQPFHHHGCIQDATGDVLEDIEEYEGSSYVMTHLERGDINKYPQEQTAMN